MRESGDRFTVLSWNLFHGRDAPPDPALFTWRSRLFKTNEDNGRYIQVNRSLREEFTSLIADASWSVCLLQEVPPDWAEPIATRSNATYLRSLTSRNQLAILTRALGRWNPDLIASWEGGSNVTLVRHEWRIVPGSQQMLMLNPFPARALRERRRMSFLRVVRKDGGPELCVANLHGSGGRPRAEPDVRRAAATASGWAGSAPLLLGGDFNVRPHTSRVFEELERNFGLAAPTGDRAIDHLLVRGLRVVEQPADWPPEQRELEVSWNGGSRRMRLSDHAPVEATFEIP